MLQYDPDPDDGHLAGELGVLAFKRGYAEWSEGDRDAEDQLAQYTFAALDELRTASASLGLTRQPHPVGLPKVCCACELRRYAKVSPQAEALL